AFGGVYYHGSVDRQITGFVSVDGSWRYSSTGIKPEAEIWYHVAMSYNSTSREIKTYVNGELKDTTILSGLNSYEIDTSTYSFEIGYTGAPSDPQWFNGTIDEVRIYNRALNASEIQAHYEEYASLPDLTISSSDISFSNPNPVVNEAIMINASVWNIGDGEAVQTFYDNFEDEVIGELPSEW
ncbi:MAG: LamG domain-containing protein, partial [Thermodesulfovibrionales bacterium]|nr:LamG domain-containing protein [Thermodesulfovibrionales bacterium]